MIMNASDMTKDEVSLRMQVNMTIQFFIKAG